MARSMARERRDVAQRLLADGKADHTPLIQER
jgi:hypothetical protein